MDMRHLRPSLVEAATLGLLVAALTAGCSLGDTRKAVVSKGGSEASKLVQAKVPTKVANAPTLRKNIVQTACAAIPGGWKASGTAANPGKRPVTYKIVVFFTTTKATTLNYAETRVPVEPGKKANWTAEKKFPAEKQMLCPMPGISTV